MSRSSPAVRRKRRPVDGADLRMLPSAWRPAPGDSRRGV